MSWRLDGQGALRAVSNGRGRWAPLLDGFRFCCAAGPQARFVCGRHHATTCIPVSWPRASSRRSSSSQRPSSSVPPSSLLLASSFSLLGSHCDNPIPHSVAQSIKKHNMLYSEVFGENEGQAHAHFVRYPGGTAARVLPPGMAADGGGCVAAALVRRLGWRRSHGKHQRGRPILA